MSTTIQFYHLLSTSPERAVPKLMEKALAGGNRVVMLLPSDEQRKRMSDALWTTNPDGFLPHGNGEDARACENPIVLATEEANPNGADILCVLGGAHAASAKDFAKVLDVFDGSNEAEVAAARTRWSRYKADGFALQYVKQQPGGGWKVEAEAA
ncbi:MAG: DNA polymerase III subunit chi [Alphaproteobacteria bacterium]